MVKTQRTIIAAKGRILGQIMTYLRGEIEKERKRYVSLHAKSDMKYEAIRCALDFEDLEKAFAYLLSAQMLLRELSEGH